MNKLLAVLALGVGLATTPALADFVVTPGGAPIATASVADNDFAADLAALGLTSVSYGATLALSTGGTVEFFVYGAESVYHDSFVVGGTTFYDESTDPAPAGQSIGSFAYAAGSIANLLFHVVSSNGGPGTPADAAIGTPGFAIFYGSDPSFVAFGFDDNGANPEDNHDDLIILARIVPEPATWMLMIAGFAALGFAQRRRTVQA